MINLRRQFEIILRDYGEEVEYIRLTNLPCPECKGKDPDLNNCKTCIGTGKKVKSEKVLTRSEAQSVPQSWPRMVEKEPIGDWQQPIYLFYFKHDFNPSLKDLVIKENRIYEIEFTDPLKGREGRIEYWRAGAQNKPSKDKLI